MKPFFVDQVAVGQEFRKAREFLGLSINQLARESGVAVSHVWNLERAQKEMSLEKFFLLCAHLGLPAGQLLSDNVTVNQEFLYQKALPEISGLEKFKSDFPTDKERENFCVMCAEHVAACATVICYSLLSSGAQSVIESIEYPGKVHSAAFAAITFHIRNKIDLKERRRLLTEIIEKPYRIVSQFDLPTAPFFNEFLKYLKEKNKSNVVSVVWYPRPKNSFAKIYSEGGSLATLDPASFSKSFRKLSERSLNSQIDFFLQQWKKPRQKAPAKKKRP